MERGARWPWRQEMWLWDLSFPEPSRGASDEVHGPRAIPLWKTEEPQAKINDKDGLFPNKLCLRSLLNVYIVAVDVHNRFSN